MLEVKIGHNTTRKTICVEANTTLADAFAYAGMDISDGIIYFNGASITPGDLSKTFAEHGVTEKATLSCVVKMSNA